VAYVEIIWDLDDDENGNVLHIAQYGIHKQDVADILFDSHVLDFSRSTGSPIAFGVISDGRTVAVVYEQVDDVPVYPITAYENEA